MKFLDEFFHGEFGASRAYLLSKVFLVMTALDTWMLMLGHSGRYGVAGFNVAHFEWLDAVQPIPTASFYIGVLITTGLLALVVALTRVNPWLLFTLFVLYTFSWSMSMLDSYQHHYFMSLVLLCLPFFPASAATDVHPRHELELADDKRKKKKQRELDRIRGSRSRGWLYLGGIVAAIGVFLVMPRGESWVPFLVLVAVVLVATWLHEPPKILDPSLTRGFGYPLLGATICILYVYTAIAKMDDNWYAGHTMRALSQAEVMFAPLAEYAARFGVSNETFWSALAISVIPLEIVIALGYLLGPLQDRIQAPLVRRACTTIFVLAITLHVGNESMNLKIGWFSYYMMVLAAVFMLPLSAVDKLATLTTWPARWVQETLAEWQQAASAPGQKAVTLGMSAAAGFTVGCVGFMLDLPGALEACLLAAAVLIGASVHGTLKDQGAAVRRYLLATGVSACLMWGAVAVSDTRWDFYRYLGGDLYRRGEPEAALEVYLKGERYAPKGQSRQNKIDQIKKQLGKD